MKRRSVIKQQPIKKNRPKRQEQPGRFVKLVRSFSFKLTIGVAAFVAVSLFFLFMYQWLLSSPYVKLETVIIEGVDEKTKNELLEMSQLSADMSLLAVNSNKLKQRLERHPWIWAVDIEKRLPHTIIIRAEKEVPQAIVALDKISYMNRRGMIFKELNNEDDIDYPVITGISKNEHIKVRQLKLAADILQSLDMETGPLALPKLSEIHVNENGGVELYSVSFPFAIKMIGSDFKTKRDSLEKVVAHLNKTGLIHTVKAIDLNYQNGVVVSFKKG